MKKHVVATLAPLVVYGGLLVWLTWPLAAHFSTHLPSTTGTSRFDTLFAAWVLAHQSHALMTDPARLADAGIFHPAPSALFYGPTGFGALPYFGPPFLLTNNPALALNLTFLTGIMLSAWILHLVVLRWTGSHLAGFIAAWTLLMTRWTLWEWVPQATQFAVLSCFPLIVLLAAAPATRFISEMRLLPLIVLQALCDLVYIAPAVLLPLGFLGVVRLLRQETRAAGGRLLAVLVLSVLFLLPFYAGYLGVSSNNPDLRSQTVWTAAPRPTNLPWGLLGEGYPTAVPPVALVLVFVGALTFVFNARRRRETLARRAWLHGGFWAVAGLLMCVTPVVQWYGAEIRLPHVLLAEWVPMYGALRATTRLGVASLMGLCILSGIAFAECCRRVAKGGRWGSRALVGRTALAVFLAVAMYAQYSRGLAVVSTPPRRPLPPSYPIAEAITDASPLIRILREPGGPLLELPVGPRGTWPGFHARAMYRSIFHWRPLLNGYSSYWPAGFRERMALANRLPDPAALAALRDQTGLEMILVHTAIPIGEQRDVWLTLTESGGRDDIRVVARDGTDVLFSVTDGGRERED